MAQRRIPGQRLSFQGIGTTVREHERIIGFALVFLVTACAVLISAQGWRTRIPAFDLTPHIYNARNLLDTGALPQRGDTGSYGSYKPPGTAWLMLPGIILSKDPRISDYTGTALLHFLTLAGIFLLARRYFGMGCACLAVVLYGLSDIGLFLAGSLWPNGRPEFFIWMVFFASLWVSNKDSKYLACAIAVWAIGMYVDMGIAPAIFILPGLWLVFRPPVRLKPLFAAGVLVLVVWFPYLRFETGRGFADLKSQLLLQNIFTQDYRDSWCDPSLVIKEWDSVAIPPQGSAQPPPTLGEGPNWIRSLQVFAGELWTKIHYNFQAIAPVPGASTLLLGMAFAGILLLSISGLPGEPARGPKHPRWYKHPLTWVALGMIFSGILANEYVIAYVLRIESGLGISTISSLRKLEKVLVLGGIALLVGRWAGAAAEQGLSRLRVQILTKEQADRVRVLVYSLLIPWFILLLVAEPDKPERFWWLWPLQVVFLAAFVTTVLPQFRAPRTVVWVSSLALILVILSNSFLFSRIRAWRQMGWAGPDAPEVQVVDFLANQLKTAGKDQAAIGYHLFIYQFMAAYHITNPQYKVGGEIDLVLKYRHGISNTETCAEGLSPLDEYRVVQTRPKDEVWSPREYFDVPLERNFHLLREIEPYQIFRRQQVTQIVSR